MPRQTARFEFEFKMMAWAARFAEVLTGDAETAFLMALDASGAVCRIVLGQAGFFPRETQRLLRESHPSWLFFDPFDGPVHTFMAWENVQRSTIERLMGIRFDEADLVAWGSEERIEFPISWDVMF